MASFIPWVLNVVRKPSLNRVLWCLPRPLLCCRSASLCFQQPMSPVIPHAWFCLGWPRKVPPRKTARSLLMLPIGLLEPVDSVTLQSFSGRISLAKLEWSLHSSPYCLWTMVQGFKGLSCGREAISQLELLKKTLP